MRCLVQRHLDTRLGEAGDRTSNLAVTSQPELYCRPLHRCPVHHVSTIVSSAGGPGGRAAEGAEGVAGQDGAPGPEHQGLGAPAAAGHGPAPGAGTGARRSVHTGSTQGHPTPGFKGTELSAVAVQWFPALCPRPASLFSSCPRRAHCDPVSQP